MGKAMNYTKIAAVLKSAFEFATVKTHPVTGGIALIGSGGQGLGSKAVVRPVGFTFNFLKFFPFTVFLGPAGATTDFDWRSVAPNPAFYGNVYYVKPAGSDAAAGTSWATAVKSIWKATELGNSAAQPFIVYIASGTYDRANAFCNAAIAVRATQSCAYVAVGGRVECGVWGALTWTLNSGTTYQVTRSNANRVVDYTRKDEFGDYIEYPKAASLVDCRATQGTWFTDGTTTYINRHDGAAVTDTNTKLLLQSVAGIVTPSVGNMYLEGIDQVGGNDGALWGRDNVTCRLVAKDCTFKSPTNSGGQVDAVPIIDIDLAVFINCTAARGQKDGFNFHEALGKEPAGITINCIGRHNGSPTVNSCNGITYHDGCKGIDIGGKYFSNRGGNCAHTNPSTQVWHIGTQAWDSLGDGNNGPIDFQAIGSATLYLYGCGGYSDTPVREETGGLAIVS